MQLHLEFAAHLRSQHYSGPEKLRAGYSPKWKRGVDLALPECNFEETILAKSGTPAILANPVSKKIIETNHFHTMQTHGTTPDMRVDTARVGIKILKDLEHAHHRPDIFDVLFALHDIVDRDLVADLNSLAISLGARGADHVLRLIGKTAFLGDALR